MQNMNKSAVLEEKNTRMCFTVLSELYLAEMQTKSIRVSILFKILSSIYVLTKFFSNLA